MSCEFTLKPVAMCVLQGLSVEHEADGAGDVGILTAVTEENQTLPFPVTVWFLLSLNK